MKKTLLTVAAALAATPGFAQNDMREMRTRCGDVPVDALAVSLGCEFLARAAVEQPAHPVLPPGHDYVAK